MTKVVFSTMKRVMRLEFTHCHCEEDSMDDAAIHRASENANGNCGLFPSPLSLFTLQSSLFYLLNQRIATGFRPRDDKGITFRLLAQAHNKSNGLVYLLHRFGINLSHKFSDSGNRDCLNLVHHQLGFFSKPVRLAWPEVESEQRCLDQMTCHRTYENTRKIDIIQRIRLQDHSRSWLPIITRC